MVLGHRLEGIRTRGDGREAYEVRQPDVAVEFLCFGRGHSYDVFSTSKERPSCPFTVADRGPLHAAAGLWGNGSRRANLE